MLTLPFNQNGKKTAEKNDYPLISLRGVDKLYKTAVGDFPALKQVSLDIKAGEFVSVIGKSGSGKTTLLNMITGIDRPSEGEVWVNQTAVHELGENKMARWRGINLGIVFQFFQLLPMLSVVENVMLPMDFCKTFPKSERKERALDLLDQMELADHAFKLPSGLSGGQQQRVAIARGLANDPPVIIADEPTGNLDSKTAERVFRMFNTLVSRGKTIIIVTHDNEMAKRATRVATIADGIIASDKLNGKTPLPPSGEGWDGGAND
jgi:putative ABC transport system ATP-binding protein